MKIETERLLLRELTLDVNAALYEILSEFEIMQHYNTQCVGRIKKVNSNL